MPQNFLQIQKEYLQKVWLRQPKELEETLPAHHEGDCFRFQAFGELCELYPQEIILGGKPLTGPEGILIALYALHVQEEEPQLHPLKSFKQFPGGMGYQGAFVTNSEKILHPYVPIPSSFRVLMVRIFGQIRTVEKRSRNLQRNSYIPLEASWRHLLETPFHN